MCLTKVYPKKKIIKEGVGYKVFAVDKKGLLPCFHGRWNKKVLDRGKWLKEKRFRCCSSSDKLIDGRYPFGFHLFKKLKDAKYFHQSSGSRKIEKVKFRKGCAIGFNEWACRNLETIVAKEIFIPKSGK